ncbi:LacI family DNA-binding transcriptional regulator [Caldanaerobius polysaccharolyticus]|uniref:LacI family DNA-binding transcriptional regulator n=1 Tax=Caldanaerobius polysaccharolyticus TaxID=44256 RepID=UPI00047EC06C|nr:LacI family DNA-binding transcriptional regulator [Caldanaerobius polysaccharolyticus]
MSNVTIKDVAKHAGVSIATVSRVINNNYYVSPEIEKRVLKAIKELNYYPNSIARSLKNDTTFTIGFIVSDISNDYFTSMTKAIEDVINKENYNMIVCSTDNKKEKELRYLKLLISRKVDGLILNTTGRNDDFISKLSNDLPVILVNRKVQDSAFRGDFIDSNNFEGAYTLTEHLLSSGHRKIAVINGDLSVSTGKERFEGFKKAMLQAGIEVGDDYVYRYDGDFTMESGYQGAAELLKLTDPPTAVVVMNNAMALGALKYFRVNKIKVPEDVSIASYGDIDNVELMYVQPSIVTLNARTIGRKAGEMLLERIKDRSIVNREVIYTPQLIVGNGVRRLI